MFADPPKDWPAGETTRHAYPGESEDHFVRTSGSDSNYMPFRRAEVQGDADGLIPLVLAQCYSHQFCSKNPAFDEKIFRRLDFGRVFRDNKMLGKGVAPESRL
jgi:hypothetical protein